MKQEELFAEQLKELREMSELSGEEITIDDIRVAFDEMDLDDDQLQMILNYFKSTTAGSSDSTARSVKPVKDSGTKEEKEEKNSEDSRFLQMYYADLKKNRKISESEQRVLYMSAMNGDRNAKEQLIVANLPMVVDFAKLYKGQGVPMEDLIGEGNVALAMAMDVIESEENPDDAKQMVAAMVMRAMEELVNDDLQSAEAFSVWADRANEILEKARNMSEELLRKITVDEFCRETGFEKDYVMDVIEVTGGKIEFFDMGKKE